MWNSKSQLNLGRLWIEVVSEQKWKKRLILTLEVPEEKETFKIPHLRRITTTRRFGFSKERTTGWDAWRQQLVLGLTMTQWRTCSEAVTKMGKHHKDHLCASMLWLHFCPIGMHLKLHTVLHQSLFTRSQASTLSQLDALIGTGLIRSRLAAIVSYSSTSTLPQLLQTFLPITLQVQRGIQKSYAALHGQEPCPDRVDPCS